MFFNFLKKFRKINFVTVSVFLLIAFVAQNFNLEKANAVAGVSNYLSYQGRLTDTSGNALGGAGTNYCFSFSIFDSPSGGTKLWPTTATTTTILNVANGVFNASVGDVSTVNFGANNTQYFNVNVAAQSGGLCTGVVWEELAPRQKVDSVGFARTAYDLYGGEAQIGDPAGVVSGQKLLKLGVKTVSDTIGAGSCSPNGALWYNSGNGRTFVCNNNLYQVVGSSLNNQFFDITGPTTAVKTFTLPDASAVILTNAASVTIAQGGTGTTTAIAAFDALSPATTKGDIISDTGTTSIRLPVGTDGQTLVASSTSVSGLAWATPAGGGGGSPGGATTQIQFNNAGAFAGDADFTWDLTNNDLILGGVDTAITLTGITNEPAAPATGSLHIYSKSIAGRMMPKWKAPSGVDTSFQSSLGFNTINLWTPSLTSTGVGFGTVWPAGTGTFLNVVPTAGTSTQLRRARFTNIATTANQILGITSSTAAQIPSFWRGNTPGNGGFFFQARFTTELVPATTIRLFVGLSSLTTGVAAADTTTLDCAGLSHITTDTITQMAFMTRDNVTTTRTVFTVPSMASGKAYDFTMYARPNDTVIYYRLVDLMTGLTIVDSSATLTLPRNTIFMGPQVQMSNGTANTTVTTTAIGINKIYIENDN